MKKQGFSWFKIGLLCLALLFYFPGLVFAQGESRFIRGDVNGNGKLELGDIIFLGNYLWDGKPTPLILDAADTNDDGNIDFGDLPYLVSFLFAQGEPPPQPFPAPGSDPTPDALGANALLGDMNQDGQLTQEDIIHFQNYLFNGQPSLTTSDLNNDGKVDLADLVFLSNLVSGMSPLQDTLGPSIEIIFPKDNASIFSSAIAVMLKVNDPSAVKGVWVNNSQAGFLGGDGYYNSYLKLTPGRNLISVRAEDAIGNVSRIAIAVDAFAQGVGLVGDAAYLSCLSPTTVFHRGQNFELGFYLKSTKEAQVLQGAVKFNPNYLQLEKITIKGTDLEEYDRIPEPGAFGLKMFLSNFSNTEGWGAFGFFYYFFNTEGERFTIPPSEDLHKYWFVARLTFNVRADAPFGPTSIYLPPEGCCTIRDSITGGCGSVVRNGFLDLNTQMVYIPEENLGDLEIRIKE